MDINLPITVTPGYEFVADPVTGLFKITKDRLNLLGTPSCVFTLANGAILAVSIAVSDQSTRDITISGQMLKPDGSNFTSKVALRMWLSATAAAAISTYDFKSTGTITVNTGTLVEYANATYTNFLFVTDSNGVFNITFTSPADQTLYLNMVINNLVFSSGEATWTT